MPIRNRNLHFLIGRTSIGLRWAAAGFFLLFLVIGPFSAPLALEDKSINPCLRTQRELLSAGATVSRFTLAQKASSMIAVGCCDALLKAFQQMEDPRDDRIREDILYYQAECHRQEKEWLKAKKNLLALKMLIDDESNPKYSAATERLEQIDAILNAKVDASKSKTVAKESPSSAGLFNIAAAYVCIIIAGSLVFHQCLKKAKRNGKSFDKQQQAEDKEKSKARDDKSKKQKTIIIPEKELITLKEMCRNDGRVFFSKEAKGPKATNTAYQHCEEIVTKGYEMIRELNAYPPRSIMLVSGNRWMGKLHPFWADTLFGMVFVAIWTLVSFNIHDIKPDQQNTFLVARFLTAAAFIGALHGIRIMAGRTIEALDEVVTLVENMETLEKIKEYVRSIFRSPWEFYIAGVLFSFVLFIRFGLRDQGWSNDLFFILFLIGIVSPLLWFLIRGMQITHYISRMRELEINPLSPLKTLGLQKWINVVGSYAMVGSIVLTLGGSIPIIKRIVAGEGLSPSNFAYLLIFLPLIFLSWIYPYAKMKGMVRRIKRRRMHFFRTMISQSFDDWQSIERRVQLYRKHFDSAEDGEKDLFDALDSRARLFNAIKPEFEQLSTYYEVFKEIDKSPESFFDLRAAMELAQVLGLPTLFAALSYFIDYLL